MKQRTKEFLEVLEYASFLYFGYNAQKERWVAQLNREMATHYIVLCEMIAPSRVNQIYWLLFSVVVIITVVVT